MDNIPLAAAVEFFAAQTLHFTEADLEKNWVWRDYDEGIRFAFFRTYEELRGLAAIIQAGRDTSIGKPHSHAHRILAQYHLAYRDLQAMLIGLSDEEAALSPVQETWSVTKTLRHILGAERGFFFTILYALESARGSGNPPHELSDEGWEAFWGDDPFDQFEQDLPTSQLLAYSRTLHTRMLSAFASITDDELLLPAKFWEVTPMPIQFRLHRYDSHLRQHAVQIEKTLAALGLFPSEAIRLLRLIFNALAEVEGALIGQDDFYLGQRVALAGNIQARTQDIAALAKKEATHNGNG